MSEAEGSGAEGSKAEESRESRESKESKAERRARADYTGGVYGSLLAASVVVGAGATGPVSRLELVLLLLGTGLVFWIAHVHAELFGARLAQRQLPTWRAALHVCRDEWPIVKAAVPPAVAAAVSPLFGLDARGGAWLALAIAVAGQMGWSAAAARRARAPWFLVAVSAAVNLLLGLLIIVFKIFLEH
ncbi:hypothetical protein ABZ845_08225 [Streptomyces sp. NPDC047022]|uniref:hypothetical protein n=1 Tax=Streptomyces sp. NPDC047022 TaxID=3155737 RepID=UPI0033C7D45B